VKLEERLAIAEEAAALEAAGADWNTHHVIAVLGMSRATIYNTPWLMRVARRIGKRSLRWSPRQVRAAQAEAPNRRKRT
jgi:predicted DNA-binding transcriptional regulator AlpA